MSAIHLSTYLRDHLAGADAAVEIMDHIESSHGEASAGAAVRQVRPEILADRAELARLVETLGHSASTPRRVFGWLAEKTVELKLKIDDPSDGQLRLLESLEILSLGIEGKLGLWKALDGSTAGARVGGTTDYNRLIQRAQLQRELIEAERLRAARALFVSGTE
ncbi:MAG: hypothetical protein M3Y64_10530 [Gemmatimonadota bacterium]|nr:hypothetical protein [Gemmatimonadota bacterium]